MCSLIFFAQNNIGMIFFYRHPYSFLGWSILTYTRILQKPARQRQNPVKAALEWLEIYCTWTVWYLEELWHQQNRFWYTYTWSSPLNLVILFSSDHSTPDQSTHIHSLYCRANLRIVRCASWLPSNAMSIFQEQNLQISFQLYDKVLSYQI